MTFGTILSTGNYRDMGHGMGANSFFLNPRINIRTFLAHKVQEKVLNSYVFRTFYGAGVHNGLDLN